MAEVTIVADGGIFVDEAGNPHFIRGYGAGRDLPLDLDPSIDLTAPIWEQVQGMDENYGYLERTARLRR